MRTTVIPATRQAVVWTIVLVSALALATTLRQTFHRPGTPFGDFAHLTLGAECLIEDCNPYDAAALNRERTILHQTEPEVWAQAPVYPPSSLLLTLPFALVGWPAGALAFDLAGGVLFGAACALMIWRLRLGPGPATLILLTCLVCNPIIAALEFANPSLLTASLAATAVLLLWPSGGRQPSSTSGWLLLGVALALKPQLVAGPLILLLCWRNTRRDASQAAALAFTLLLIACAAYRIRLGSFDFLVQLGANLHMSMLPGSTSDFSRANPDSFDFLNLQTMYSRLPRASAGLADSLAWVTAALITGATLWLLRRRGDAPRPVPACTFPVLLALATLISLMSLYHRGYDRVIALLLAPAAAAISIRSSKLAWLYAAMACWWIANDTLLQYGFRRWHLKPQNPAEELILCVILLASLHWMRREPSLEHPLEVDSIAG